MTGLCDEGEDFSQGRSSVNESVESSSEENEVDGGQLNRIVWSISFLHFDASSLMIGPGSAGYM